MTDADLSELLLAHRADVARYVDRHAGRLLRHETTDDLVQAIHLRALQERSLFQFQGREAFLAWIHAVARGHMADRHSYWSALRRRPARLVRLVLADDDTRDPLAAAEPAGNVTGPSTFASRREQLARAVRALSFLRPRDRDLVQWTCEDVDADEQATRLGVSREAADRARRRAVERLRKVHELLSAGGNVSASGP